MHSILVKDHMDTKPLAINENASIRDVVHRLVSARRIGAPVVDDSLRVVGFVSEQDCIKEMLNDAFFCEESFCAKHVMNTDVQTVSPDSSIFEVAERMVNQSPKNYPVVQNDMLVGMISRSKILEALLIASEDCYLHH